MNTQALIERLALQPHVEGGFFRRSYCSPLSLTTEQGEQRASMTAIYYLLTADSPIGFFHRNRSDILHFWHEGEALHYHLIDCTGTLSTVVLGPDISQGQQLQLLVPGGVWKATQLMQGRHGLLSESVCPGYDERDSELATAATLESLFPSLWQQRRDFLSKLCKPA